MKMKKYLAFEVLLELILQESEKKIEEITKLNKQKTERNQKRGYEFFKIQPIPNFNSLLIQYAEKFSDNRIMVPFLDENMVTHNYDIAQKETEQIRKEMETQMKFYSRLKYCGD